MGALAIIARLFWLERAAAMGAENLWGVVWVFGGAPPRTGLGGAIMFA